MIGFNKKTNIDFPASSSDNSSDSFSNQTGESFGAVSNSDFNSSNSEDAVLMSVRVKKEKSILSLIGVLKFVIPIFITIALAMFGWFLINQNGPINRLEQFKDTSEKRLDKTEEELSSTNKRINKLEKGLVEYNINISTED